MVIVYNCLSIMKKKALIAVLLFAAVSGLGLFAYQSRMYRQTDEYYGKPHKIDTPDFVLTDHNGDEMTLKQFRGKTVLIAWGYTNCPDVCPLTLSKLRKVLEELGEGAQEVQVLFITVDPERDTPERLKSYVPFFNKDFIGVTGTQEDIERVAENYGVTIVKHPAVYGRSEEDHWDRYLLTHTNTVFLVDRGGDLFLAYPHYQSDSEGIASDLKRLLYLH